LLLVLSMPSSTLAWAEEAVTVESLLAKMVDLRWLATPPAAGERTVQFSSYDRASKLVDGKIVKPFANGDRGHYLRVDTRADGSKEYVLAEAEGPGFVSRIWSANPDGELRIYIDGAAEPIVAADFKAITNGDVPPFVAPFGHDASRGRNLYFPLPFAKSIKVVTSKGDQYFQVNVTHLPPGTKVESVSRAVLERAAGLIAATGKALLDSQTGRPEGAQSFEMTIAPGESFAFEHEGPAVMTWLRMQPRSDDLEGALAKTLIVIHADGAKEPQVTVPLGEFFGTGPGLNVYHTSPTTVAKDGVMTSRWPVPFAKTLAGAITNGSSKPVTIRGEVGFEALEAGTPVLHFFARWKARNAISTVAGDGTEDWRALTAKGAPGRFVGLLLNVFNPTPAWWGEGDEKIYVDGEAFPSTFGTGTEDYFGYAWCDPTPYSNPFHAQTRCDGPQNFGNTSNVRWQILDQVPWSESIAFDMEVWHWKAVKVDYASVAFFYAGDAAVVEPSPATDLSGREIKTGEMAVTREPGAIEGEALKVESMSGGRVQKQDMMGFGEQWSGASQLWWTGLKPSMVLKLTVPVAKAGDYDVSAGFTKAKDYGTFDLKLENTTLGAGPIDLFHAPDVVHSGSVALGRVHLDAGPATLTITAKEKNADSSNHLLGLDWIKLTPAP
jgi:hypothetical protein